MCRAEPLLYERGLDGIGVAELCATLEISKETLYRHFGSKAGLVSAVLQARSEKVVRWLERASAEGGSEAADQLAAVFDALEEWHASDGFRGCAIVNAAAQHRTGRPGEVAERHLDGLLDILMSIARRTGVVDSDVLARQLLMLVEGATVLADLHGDPRAASRAKQAALVLLRAAAREG
jgi:AcrR family transcriptional regulator